MKRNTTAWSVVIAVLLVFVTPMVRAQRNDIQVVEAPPVETTEPSLEAPTAAAPGEPTLTDIMEELSRLREEVARLRDLLETYLSQEAADLHKENEGLRREAQPLAIPKEGGLRHVPMPDKELLKGLVEPKPGRQEAQETEPAEKPIQAAEAPPPKNVPPPAKFKSEVLSEWGRTPTEAAKSIPKVGSLKGMICVVPPGSRDEDLIALARKLHKEYATYDNINIEVFDDAGAARAFKENEFSSGAASPSEHRVLSISKHSASGRDVILLIKGEQTIEVPIEE